MEYKYTLCFVFLGWVGILLLANYFYYRVIKSFSGRVTMQESIISIAEFRLIPEYLEKISEDGKVWLARAIVNILIADKHLAVEEKGFFKDAILMLENDEIRGELIEAVKKHETVELGELTTDRDYAGHFFFFLGMVIAADGKIKTSEFTMLSKICGKLGFPEETSKEVLHWVTEMIKLNNDRNQMTKFLGELKPVFVSK